MNTSYIKKFVYFFIFLEIICLLIIWSAVFIKLDNNLYLYFLNVGQGDGILIRTPAKQNIIIDGGPDNTILEKLGYFLPIWNKNIDLLILTHSDPDHINGALEILNNFQVKLVLDNLEICESWECQTWNKKIQLAKITKIPVNQLEKMIINPKISLAFFVSSIEKIGNNSSIVSKLNFGDFDSLFLGDIEKAVENEILTSNFALDSEIIKIAHHGSRTSTSESLLNSVSPILAIISVGKNNKFGHPHPETLEK